MKIKIANKDYDIDKDIVNAIESEREEAKTQLTNAQTARDTATTSLSEAQTIVNTLKGENAALKSQAGDEVDVQGEAKKLVIQHDNMVNMLKTLGSKTALTFGKYDAADELRAALGEFGVEGLENSDYSALTGVYQGVSATLKRKSGQGALETVHSSPAQLAATESGIRPDRGRERVTAKISNGLFSGKKAATTEGQS